MYFFNTGNQKYRDVLDVIVENIERYIVAYDGQYHLPNPTFDGFGLDVAHGLAGIYLFLEEVEKNECL